MMINEHGDPYIIGMDLGSDDDKTVVSSIYGRCMKSGVVAKIHAYPSDIIMFIPKDSVEHMRLIDQLYREPYATVLGEIDNFPFDTVDSNGERQIYASPLGLKGFIGSTYIFDDVADELEKYKQMVEGRGSRDIFDEEPEPRDISTIKKDIKHCKNPMERAKLERELNSAYIDKRNKRRASKASKKRG